MSGIGRHLRCGIYMRKFRDRAGTGRARDASGTRKVQADGSQVSHAWWVSLQVAPGRSDPLAPCLPPVPETRSLCGISSTANK